MRTVSTVERIITRGGEVGGLILGDGSIIETPPKHGDTLRAMLRRGDEVRVEGEARRGRRGRLRIRARTIATPKDGQFPRSPERLETVGRVKRFLFNANGRMNGIRLWDGTVVKTPPRQSEQILAHVRYGDKVRIEGRSSVSNSGKLVADTIHILHHYSEANAAETPSLSSIVDRAIALLKQQRRILEEFQTLQDLLIAQRSQKTLE